MIDLFGERLVSLWRELRPTTRRLVEHALSLNAKQSAVKRNRRTTKAKHAPSGVLSKDSTRRRPQPQQRRTHRNANAQAKHRNTASTANTKPQSDAANLARAPYDARAELELRRLLAAFDERLRTGNDDNAGLKLDARQSAQLRHIAETCAAVLLAQAQSAEAFAQLLERALQCQDYAAIDGLADAMARQLPVSEVCELVRSENREVRALAFEVLAQMPVSQLIEFVSDPIDAPFVREAIFVQAFEYGSDEAQWVVEALSEPVTDFDED